MNQMIYLSEGDSCIEYGKKWNILTESFELMSMVHRKYFFAFLFSL